MEWEKTFEEAIRARRSCRSYDARAIEEEKIQKLKAFLEDRNKNIRGVRFVLLDLKDTNGKIGTYGMIAGARNFFAGIIDRNNTRIEELGLEFEKVILYAASLGLGTCWLAGIDRKTFDGKVDLSENEVVAVASPVGYAKPIGFKEGLVRRVVNADKRKPWEELFFNGRPDNPLTRDEAGVYALPLEMARLAPSASNKQPWRLICDGKMVHFCLLRTKGYGAEQPFDIQRSDVGIAMCHFELMAASLKLKGKWTELVNIPLDGQFVYIKTWDGDDGSF